MITIGSRLRDRLCNRNRVQNNYTSEMYKADKMMFFNL